MPFSVATPAIPIAEAGDEPATLLSVPISPMRSARGHSRSVSLSSQTTAAGSEISLGGETVVVEPLDPVPENDLEPGAGTTYSSGRVTVEFPNPLEPERRFLRITQPTKVDWADTSTWRATLPCARDIDGQPVQASAWRTERYPASLIRVNADETWHGGGEPVLWANEAMPLRTGDYAHLEHDELRLRLAQSEYTARQDQCAWYLRRLEPHGQDPEMAVWEYELMEDWAIPQPEVLVTDGEHTASVQALHLERQGDRWVIPSGLNLDAYDPSVGIESDNVEDLRRLVDSIHIASTQYE